MAPESSSVKWASFTSCSVVGSLLTPRKAPGTGQCTQWALLFFSLGAKGGALEPDGLVGIPALTPTSCVALGKRLNLSVSQFSHRKMGAEIVPASFLHKD